MGRVPLLISSTRHHEGGIDCMHTLAPIPLYVTQHAWAFGLLGQRQRQDNKQQPLKRAGAFVCICVQGLHNGLLGGWGGLVSRTDMKKTLGFQTHLPTEFNLYLGLKKAAMRFRYV